MKTGNMEHNQPVILERKHHRVSRKQIDPDALKVLYRLYRHGYKAYLVGGAVRDLLLDKAPKDFDVVTDARPGQIKKLFANCFLIGRRFRLAHIRFRGGKIVEVATFRKEPDNPEEQSPDRNNTFGAPIEDAFRRDITINGLFYDISTFSIIDYVGGLEDIERGRVCIIGNPQERYEDDPVRMWRVLRHASRLGFAIEKATADAIVANKDLFTQCSGARLFEELNKDMSSGFTSPLFRLFLEFGILHCLFGEIGTRIEQSARASDKLFALLQAADSAVKSGGDLSQEARYTLLFWPWAEELIAGNNEQNIDKMQLFHDAFAKTDMPIVIPKSLRAGITQTTYIVERMCRAMETGRMRWSLTKRSRYQDASLVFSILHTEGLLPVKDPFEHIFREKYKYTPAKRRKRRYRGRTRKSSSGSEAVSRPA